MGASNISITLQLTPQQQQDFTACAKTCGLDLAVWIVQCASVQAAAVIDAVQATPRHNRFEKLADNEPINARNRERRRVREKEGESLLTVARAYNTRFKAQRPKAR